MPEPTTNAIATWVDERASNEDVKPLIAVLNEVLAGKLAEYSAEAVADLAEAQVLKVGNELATRAATQRGDGVIVPFELSVIDGQFYFRKVAAPERELLQNLRGIDPLRFERVCAELLRRLSGESKVTGGTNDGGVDFLGVGLDLAEKVRPVPQTARVIVIGQAKRYDEGNTVTEVDMRKFVGGALRKSDEFRRANSMRSGILSPIIYAFWTTGRFNPGAKKYAMDMGIWYLSGIGLAQLMIRLGLTSIDEIA